MPLDTTSLAALLEALRNWLIENPDGDIQEFADEHGVEVADLADAWQANFVQGDFSRNYDLDTNTTQAGAQGAVQAAPAYTPSEPPPYGSSPEVYHEYLTQEVSNYQEFTTVNNITNNIEDNSFNQQIVDSEVQQEIDIDNSDVEQGDNSVNIDESELLDSPVNTGNVGPGGVLQQGDGNAANTGDVTATDGSSATVFGDATTTGSGNDNFGDGQNAVTTAVGDNNEQATVNQDERHPGRAEHHDRGQRRRDRRSRRGGRRRWGRRRRRARLLLRRSATAATAVPAVRAVPVVRPPRVTPGPSTPTTWSTTRSTSTSADRRHGSGHG